MSARIRRRDVVLGGLAASLVPRVATAEELAPLTPSQRKILTSIPADPPPKRLSNGQHFLVSDELHPERLRHALAGLGGVFIGVGPEQNYLYAAWARARILILLDFDQVVVDLHHIYAAFMRVAETPRRMLDLWRSDASYLAREALEASEPNAKRRRHLMTLYRRARLMVHGRLGAIATKQRKLDVSSFLTDATHYGHVRDLVLKGRTVAVRGDLTADKAMRGVAAAARELEEPVRGLYLSNVELYVDYASGLGDNCRAQPTDARSKLLRTVFKSPRAHDRYHYCEQRARDFEAWLDTEVKDLDAMMEEADARIDRRRAAWVIPGPAHER